ncbi:sensor histidine kinase [Pedobacter hiemivivus]|uniref:histidine kinase n=1 Tax=Pedobacter hiemivivus TaxID=2530454 RepID=A0A4R0N4F1_9SPHI|nr:7TM diverse intracellular signaling domain-containing protein [Pedobacter hiemivivus]TCC94740.1 GHKL domain-containing protein [Pedobacter hiemivivus]
MIKSTCKKLVFLIFFLCCTFFTKASFRDSRDSLFNLTEHASILINFPDKATINWVMKAQGEFKRLDAPFINFGKIDKTVWLKADFPNIKKSVADPSILIDQARLEIADIYFVKDNHVIHQIAGQKHSTVASFDFPGNTRSYVIPRSVVDLDPEIYIKLYSDEVIIAPVYVAAKIEFDNIFAKRDIFFGIYTGIMIIMFAYNLFLYFSIKDSSYLNYIFCIIFTWATQVTLQGYFTKYFLIDYAWFDNIAVILFANLGLIASILFTQSFLNTRVNAPKSHRIINILLTLSVINTVILLFGFKHTSFTGMQVLILAGSIIGTYTAYQSFFHKKFKPAGYYLASWSFLFFGMMIFILKDYEVLPYNTYTNYSVQFTSVIEVMLLSFALADKINFFKKENEIAQKRALLISKENEQLILQQNIELEKKVNERTEALQETNANLNHALSNLKAAQSQLVDAEKMAALGQLTAGIAHEINNPINFVTSNIKPLQLDIDDLKEIINRYEQIDYSLDVVEQIKEIDAFKNQIDLAFINNEIESLLTGISDGAKRTAEIIRSLRNFSRLDEDDLKPIDLNEGLQSTLVLVKNTMPDNLKVYREFGNLPKIECLPGKINQVFMNLISNAIQAIKSNGKDRKEEQLTIKTWYEDAGVKISIKDTGTGMTDEVKHKIFEPFFTTKEVGEGTGLGLSIVFSIIEKHKGHIDVISEVDKGTEFIITLPVNTQ